MSSAFSVVRISRECKGVFSLSFSYEILPCLRVVIISRRAEKSVKEYFRYRFRMEFFRVFCVFRGSNLSRVYVSV